MKQKEIYLADLNPSRGSEQGGQRPVVVISGNTMNDNLGIAIVCPISSKIKNYAGSLVLKKNKVNNLKTDSEIIAFQVRTIAKERLVKKIGKITNQELEKIISLINDVFHF